MAAEPVPRRLPDLQPKHTIFLSHSGEEKPFVDLLRRDMVRAKLYPFFDQDRESLPIGERFAPKIFEAAKQCRVAVVVLSPGYMKSKWPMLELIKFHESINEKNPLQLVPLFYKLTPDDLREAGHGDPKQDGDKLISPKIKIDSQKIISSKEREDHERKLEAVKKTWEEWKRGWHGMKEVRGGQVVFDEKLCEDAIKVLRQFNGIVFTPGNKEVNYLEDVVTEVYKLSRSTFPFDTSDIRGCDRLCKVISEMFVDNGEGTQFLGLYGDEGSGKTTICCEAMCSYLQDEFQGKVSRVQLETSDTNSAVKKREKRLRQVLKDLLPTDQRMQHIRTELQLRSYLKNSLQQLSQKVFLVVDNVSQSSREEAEFYVSMAEFARGSKVLVTSRNQKILESLFKDKDKQFCHPIPGLKREEASELILSKAASSKLTSPLDKHEEIILGKCIARGLSGKHYSPLTLRTLAASLQAEAENKIPKWEPIIESLNNNDIRCLQLREYEKLDKTSKLVFLDLALFVDNMYLTHEEVQDVMEHDKSFHEVVTCIALLHGVAFRQAKMMVRKLKNSVIIDWDGHPSRPEISVPEDYVEFAQWLITTDENREEKDWCMLCLPAEEVESDDEDEPDFEDSEDESEADDEFWEFADLRSGADVSKLVRVRICGLSLTYRDHLKIQQWRYVACLELIQVRYLQSLDLQGLHSLRVLMVDECDDLERIVCTCESSLTKDGPHFCYDQYENDDDDDEEEDEDDDDDEEVEPPSGCMPNLRFVQLMYLPRLKCASFTVHCWNLETLWFFDCANLEMLPDLRYSRNLKKLRLPCGDFQGFQGLSRNKDLTELALHWDPKTVRNFTEEMKVRLVSEMLSLEKLRVLDIVDERRVYEWIPAGFQTLNMTKLVNVTFLDLSYATTIQTVEGLEEMFQLQSLGLYGCCNLLMLPDLSDFQHLKLCIGHCHKLVLDEESVLPWDTVTDFHESQESCSFGEHECLPPFISKKGSCKMCESQRDPKLPCLQQDPQMPYELEVSQEQVVARGNSGGRTPIEGAFGRLDLQDEDVEQVPRLSSVQGGPQVPYNSQRGVPTVEETLHATYGQGTLHEPYGQQAPQASYGHQAPQAAYGHQAPQASYGQQGLQALYEQPPQASYAQQPQQASYGHQVPQASYVQHPPQASYGRQSAQMQELEVEQTYRSWDLQESKSLNNDRLLDRGGNDVEGDDEGPRRQPDMEEDYAGYPNTQKNYGGHIDRRGNYGEHGTKDGNYGEHGAKEHNYREHGATEDNYGGHGARAGNYGGHGGMEGNYGEHRATEDNYGGHGAMGDNYGGHGIIEGNYGGHGTIEGNYGGHGTIEGNYGGHGTIEGNYGGHGAMVNYRGQGAMEDNYGGHRAMDGIYGGDGSMENNYQMQTGEGWNRYGYG